jgi:single-strand DNA-binding protein
MAIHTQQSVSGFVASEPQLTSPRRDAAALHEVRAGALPKGADNSFTKLETTFHDLIAFGRRRSSGTRAPQGRQLHRRRARAEYVLRARRPAASRAKSSSQEDRVTTRPHPLRSVDRTSRHNATEQAAPRGTPRRSPAPNRAGGGRRAGDRNVRVEMNPIDTPTPEPEVPDDFDPVRRSIRATICRAAAPDQLEPAVGRRPGSRAAGTEPLGRLAAPHLRTARQRDPAHVAPPPRTALGTVRAAPALAVRLRPRAERLRTAGLAPRLRRRPPAPPRLGSRQRHPPGPRPTHPPDHLARRSTRRARRRGADRRPRRRLRALRPR